jgi:hypothetical protein
MIDTKAIMLLTGTPVVIDDGELELEGILKSQYKDKVLLEVDAESAPREYSMDAVKAALLGFDLDSFPDDKLYVQYHVTPRLTIKPQQHEDKSQEGSQEEDY